MRLLFHPVSHQYYIEQSESVDNPAITYVHIYVVIQPVTILPRKVT